jgi:hypothetical protein
MAILNYSRKEKDHNNKAQRQALADIFSIHRNLSANTLQIAAKIVKIQLGKPRAKLIACRLETEKIHQHYCLV